MPEYDATVTAKLKESNAIILGKTALLEFRTQKKGTEKSLKELQSIRAQINSVFELLGTTKGFENQLDKFLYLYIDLFYYIII